jgi:ankyrin repeat protein
MSKLSVLAATVWVAVCSWMAGAQSPDKIDFRRDVQPIFRAHCIACHGPGQQMNGLRLDRRSSVFQPGRRRVVPGSSGNSFLYHRVKGGEYGLQMPPSGPLRPEQVQVIRTWIDQGAAWPDELANEMDQPPVNPKAATMVEALRAGARQSFLRLVEEDPKLLNARGPGGATPLMYAVLYGDAALLQQLLKKGADPRARNDSNATALMWAATNLKKTRVLLAHGAEVNTVSDEVRTPLMIAAGRPGGAPVVKLLLERGAHPNPTKNPVGESSPLVQAALAEDAASMKMLLDRGADTKAAGGMALAMAMTVGCTKCVDLLLTRNLDKDAYTFALLNVASFADAEGVRLLLEHGAEVNAVDPFGRTALHYAAVSDVFPLEVVKLLVERGADVNAASRHTQSADAGLSVLDVAQLQGETPIVDFLVKAGAVSRAGAVSGDKPHPAGTIQSAVQRSLPLLQRTDAGFTAKSGCVSCHNNSLVAMTVGLARKRGFRVDERIAAQQVRVNVSYLESKREALYQGFFTAQAGAEAFGDTFGPVVLAYVLVGLDAERYSADLNTDAAAMYLKSRQMLDGRWAYPRADTRQPLCLDYLGQTALSMRALQLYAPRANKPEYEKAVRLAAAWLAKAEPKTYEDRVWRLFGLSWAGGEKDAVRKAVREILALQRPDGGWSDLRTTKSNAYATGRTLVALQSAGLSAEDPAYRRGVQFLINTQMEDGSWHVKTRALALQPYFESGFPHGFDQWISAAGTSWATMALILASQAPEYGGAPVPRAE